jgi:putative acetyltransferase
MSVEGLQVARETILASDTIEMVMELDAYCRSLYAADCCYGFKPHQLEVPNIYFFVVRENGYPIACAGIMLCGDSPEERYTEVKRMYVRPQGRGKGIAKLLLNKLESQSRELGYSIIRLETGIHQVEAIQLYETVGYVRREVFGNYRVSDVNLFYEKPLYEDEL